MAYGLSEQREYIFNPWSFGIPQDRPWQNRPRRSGGTRFMKLSKNRRERRRAKMQPDCVPEYKRFAGWEY